MELLSVIFGCAGVSAIHSGMPFLGGVLAGFGVALCFY